MKGKVDTETQYAVTNQWAYAVDHAMRAAKVDATDYNEIHAVFVQYQRAEPLGQKMLCQRVARCGDTAERARYLSIHAQSTDHAVDHGYQCESGTTYMVGCNFH